MAKNRFQSIISRVIEIKPSERKISFLFFFYFFSFMFPFYIIKSVRDAEYLIEIHLGAQMLPIAYLLTALAIGVVVALHSKLQAKLPRSILVVMSLIFFAVTCILFGFLFLKEWLWVPVAFWVYANIVGVVLTTQFFLLVNDILNPREAKRLIGFFGSGGTLGGIFGSLLTGFLSKNIPESKDYLLFIASGMLIATVIFVMAIFVWQKKNVPSPRDTGKKGDQGDAEARKVGFKESFNTVKSSSYLKLLAAIVAVTIIVSTFIDFQAKTVINVVVDVDEMTSFFGFFYAGLLVLPFLIQILITSNFIKRFGITLSLLVFPLALLICSVGIVAWVGLAFALIIKGCDKSLSFSLNQSVRELLFIPIPAREKDKAKPFIDMFVNRFAKGVGAVILMVFLLPGVYIDWKLKVQIVSALSLVGILVWAFLNLKVARGYTNTVKERLELKWDRADKVVAAKLDVDLAKLIFDTLESKERSSVLYAMHLFDLMKQDKLTPEVKELISSRSEEAAAASFSILFDTEDATWLPEFEDRLSEEVLGKEVQEIMALDVYQEVMKGHFDKVVATRSPDAETAKMEVAKAIGLLDSSSPLVEKLDELLHDESPEVVRYAVQSAAHLLKREYVPAIIEKLESPYTREDASSALEKYGSKIVGTLADYLGDTGCGLDLRKAVASVLARISTQEAADFLSWELAEERGDMDAELLDVLDKIRSEKPEIVFPEQVIEQKIRIELAKYYKLLFSLYESRKRRETEEKMREYEKCLADLLYRIFDLLGLIYPRGDIIRAYQNVNSGAKESVAYAVELVDNVLKKELRDLILPLIEDLSLEERVVRCRTILRSLNSGAKGDVAR